MTRQNLYSGPWDGDDEHGTRRRAFWRPDEARMGATHFLTKTLPKVAAEMALSVLAYNLTRVMNIIGVRPLIAAIAG